MARFSRKAAWGGQTARELARDATWRIEPARDAVVVRVRSGCVLVTQEGDPGDHVLEAGDALHLAPRGVAVAWALSPSRVEVERPGCGTAAERAVGVALAGG